ncbi:MAG: hypothetical protein SAK29_16765 [Scytonema sp. PMC 1069.18]|nr:hypothetical protein [Scytonema sp. PMC 1069.18]MEC4887151.1 hypothetical protein [Scytonema sp. PMC 1070.18]
MPSHKITLSKDVVEKAEIIAREFGLKNIRDAVEAVFRRYSDDYLYRRAPLIEKQQTNVSTVTSKMVEVDSKVLVPPGKQVECEALDELDDLLGE